MKNFVKYKFNLKININMIFYIKKWINIEMRVYTIGLTYAIQIHKHRNLRIIGAQITHRSQCPLFYLFPKSSPQPNDHNEPKSNEALIDNGRWYR